MSKDDGGPAFPVTLERYQEYGGHTPYDGMTLRDYFAAKAMQAVLCAPMGKYTHSTYVEAVTDAYKFADLMLLERNK